MFEASVGKLIWLITMVFCLNEQKANQILLWIWISNCLYYQCKELLPHLKDVWNCKSGKSSYAGLNYSANYQVNRLMMVYWYWDPLNC